jgi:sorbitol-specific phosphotransferase system component IIBC
MTVPEVAEVVSISSAEAVTEILSAIAPTSRPTSICFMSAVCSVTPFRSAVLKPGAVMMKL